MRSCEREAELPPARRGSRSGDLHPSRGGCAGILGSHFGITFWDHIRTQAAQDERDGQVERVDTQLPLGKKNPSKTHLVFEQ